MMAPASMSRQRTTYFDAACPEGKSETGLLEIVEPDTLLFNYLSNIFYLVDIHFRSPSGPCWHKRSYEL